MQRNKKEIQNQSISSVARVSDSTLSAEPEVGMPTINKGSNSRSMGNVLDNTMKKGIEEDKDLLDNLCKQLESLGRPDKAERLKELYYIDPEDKEYAEDDNLDLESAKDFVKFFAMVDTSRGVLIGMNQYGKVSATWDDLINGGHFNIKFLGNSQVHGSLKINGEYESLNLSLLNFRSKLSKLNLI